MQSVYEFINDIIYIFPFQIFKIWHVFHTYSHEASLQPKRRKSSKKKKENNVDCISGRMFVPLSQPSWASFAIHIVVVKSQPTQKHMASCKTRSKRFAAVTESKNRQYKMGRTIFRFNNWCRIWRKLESRVEKLGNPQISPIGFKDLIMLWMKNLAHEVFRKLTVSVFDAFVIQRILAIQISYYNVI